MDRIEFKKKRKALKMTTKQLADELGLSPRTGDVYIRKIEAGFSYPSNLLLRCLSLLIKDKKQKRKYGQEIK